MNWHTLHLRRPVVTLVCAGLMGIGVEVAAADDAASPQDVMSGAPSTDPNKPVSVPSAISITSTQDSTTATLKGTFTAPTAIQPTSQETATLSATLTSPITKGEPSTNIAALNGFANSTYLTAQYSEFLVHVNDLETIKLNALTAACVQDEIYAYTLARQYAASTGQDTKSLDALIVALGSTTVCTDTVSFGNQLDPTAFELRAGIDLGKFSPPQRDALLKSLLAWRTGYTDERSALKVRKAGYAISYGLTSKVGYETHDYFQAQNLTKATVDATPWSAGGYFTYVGTGWNWALTAQYDYQDAYKDQTTKTECPAPASTAPTTCVSGAIGAPKRSTKNLFTAEWRYKVPIQKWFGGDSVGVAPSATYDATSHLYGATALLFLFGNGSGGLTGGLDASWQSDTHHVSAGIFVTQPFSISGQSSASPSK